MIRSACTSDVESIHSIQTQVYARNLVEPIRLFHEIVQCGESLVYVNDHGDICAYLLTHFINGDIPSLHESCDMKVSNRMFIHDISVKKEYRGKRIATALVQEFIKRARCEEVILVSVNDTRYFWNVFGFEEVNAKQRTDLLASYGPCHVMLLRLNDVT